MNEIGYLISLNWIAIFIYFLAATFALIALIFKKESAFPISTAILVIGVLFQGVSLGMRWHLAGHAPYFTIYEVFNSTIFVAFAIYLLLLRYEKNFQIVSVFIIPVGIAVMGWALTADPAIKQLPPTFESTWLVVHILCAKLAFGSILTASGLALAYLLKESDVRSLRIHQKLPDLSRIDVLSVQFIAFGFVFLGPMIIAGAIWADQAWGRYWSWDPIESWSLFTWFLYGLFLHLRVTYPIEGRISQILIMVILVFSLFFNFGATFIIPTIHAAYMR